MKKIVFLLMMITSLFVSFSAWSFSCKTSAGVTINAGGGSANVYVNLTPSIGTTANLVVDLSNSITCNDQYPPDYIDYVSLQSGSAFGGLLSSFSGTVIYNGSSYAFPTTTETSKITYDSTTYKPWPVILNLTPISSAGGVVITSGSLIAKLVLHQTNNHSDSASYVWNIYASNSVVIPTGGCQVSSRSLTVQLPDYPGSQSVPLSVSCPSGNKSLSYYLTGTTSGTSSTIFTNTASASAAGGVGVQLSNSSGVLATNQNVSLGTVGTNNVSLGLTASYARTSGQVTAGNVQSIVGVTFVYQ